VTTTVSALPTLRLSLIMRKAFAGVHLKGMKMKTNVLGLSAAALLTVTAVFSQQAGLEQAKIDYGRNIQPILDANCVSCHRGAAAPAELQLDSPEGLLQGGTSGAIVLPGNAVKSLLVIRTEDQGNNRMPPGGHLTPEQIQQIKAWIDQGAKADPSVDFESQIQPILRSSCYSCHSGSEPKGKLSLDKRDGALKGGAIGHDIVPGNSGGSLLLERVRGEGGRPRMPLIGTALTENQIALLQEWIQQGARWPASASQRTHWSYVKPVRPAVPVVKESAWVRNPIDNFILARLEKEGLRHSVQAKPETLARRLYLDLTGIPPSPAEVDEFLKDEKAVAYERLVEKLLASPHFGERLATPWLDQARYGDSNGYERDFQRVAWPYRDWVVKAFNENKPFDQFTIEQLAGDLLPNATADQKIATGFVRASMLNTEGGTDPEEQNWVAQLDRAVTVGNVFLGSTIQCTQCHNHKYDPFTQKQFYQLVAFFNNASFDPNAPKGFLGTPGAFTERSLNVATPEQAKKRDEISAKIEQLQQNLNASTPESRALQTQWEQSQIDVEREWTPLVPVSVRSEAGSILKASPDGAVLVSGPNPDKDAYVIEAKMPAAGKITGIRLEALPDASLPRGGPGRDYYGNFILSTLEIEAGASARELTSMVIENYLSDSSASRYSYESDKLWKSDLTRDIVRLPMALLAIPKEPLQATTETLLRITLNQRSEFLGVGLGKFRISVTTSANPQKIIEVSYDLRPLLKLPRDQRAAFVAKQKMSGGLTFGPPRGGPRNPDDDPLSPSWRNAAPELKSLRDEIAELQKQLADLRIPTALILSENMEVAHPKSYVHERGAYTAKGEELYADVPSFLGSLPKDATPNRLGLAKWLIDGNNPLTARVRVNQIWQIIFGRGIVETAEDFGTQGMPPTHPELLDWLTTEFVARGWDQKALIRTIVTSNTYRQSSEVTQELLERDPKNALLARGPRFRVEAEMVRDIALADSGLLSHKIGGPPVMPPQPDGMWDLPFQMPNDKWITSTGEDRYRRGLYIFIRRTVRYPSLTVFDAPSREVTIQRRNRSNTPLQALTTLNDPAFFEAAQAMAKRIEAEGGAGPSDRVVYGFRLVTSRKPGAEEKQAIAQAFEQERMRFARNLSDAKSICGQANPELAAWTVISNSLLNLDEAITKE
jgi:mono/diheme cytochrome c family protein